MNYQRWKLNNPYMEEGKQKDQRMRRVLGIISMALGLSACSMTGEHTPVESSMAVMEEPTLAVVNETTSPKSGETVALTTEETTTEEETIADYEVTIGEEGKSVSIHSHDYVANISGIPITDFKAFKKDLKQLPNLLYLDMCDCGLSNEQMEELQTEFPNIKFAWRVHMGTWSLRTDALAF
ncbi:MAG: hypothetical protein K6C69_04765, partial [Lachnospiraceae bacterium]|nr:hypothetical protein [Lachnospiraceae bacterium]